MLDKDGKRKNVSVIKSLVGFSVRRLISHFDGAFYIDFFLIFSKIIAQFHPINISHPFSSRVFVYFLRLPGGGWLCYTIESYIHSGAHFSSRFTPIYKAHINALPV
jgi:hypothetical protein